MSQAYADGTEPPLPDGAIANAYIDLMADESGLSRQDFIATTVNAVTVFTGVQFAANPGIRLADATLGDNLDYLIDAADYPAWDSLDATQQASYGNRQNYDASKYLSLMNAFGMDEDYQRYEEYVSSGGGHFLFSDETSDRLGRIGRIGERWKDNIAVGFGDLQALITNQMAIGEYLGRTSEAESYYFDAEGIPEWPSSVTTNVKLNYGTTFEYISTKSDNEKVYGAIKSSVPVYMAMFMNVDAGSENVSNNNWAGYIYAFSDSDFRFGYNTERNRYPNVYVSARPVVESYNNKQYYTYPAEGAILRRYKNSPFESNFQYNVIQYGNTPSTADLNRAIAIIATHSEEIITEAGGYTPDIEGYPEEGEVPQNTPIYFPPQGLNPSNTWNNFTTLQRPSNPYNPDDETATPEWQQETTQNVQGLQGIHFDKLFPFSMVYSIPNLVNVVRNGVATDSQAKNVVVVPFRWSDTYVDDLTLDLTDLVSLLVMVRPFNRVLLVFALLMALVLFWKSILTGD